MNHSKMYLKMITSSLLRRRSRMLIALLAVAIGATILSGLAAIYYDIPRQMGQEFRSYGANIIFLPKDDDSSITDDTVNELRQSIPSSDLIGLAPYRYENIRINELPFIANATDMQEAKKASPYWYVSGEWPKAPGEVMIGKELAQTIGKDENDNVTVKLPDENGDFKEHDYLITGVLQTGGSEEDYLFMSLEDMADATKSGGTYDVIEGSISQSQEKLKELSEKISSTSETVSSRLVKRVTESEGTVLTKLQALVLLVTIVVLGLTMVCVATTMMAVVVERRKEIGLKKALGASNASIVKDFLGEGAFLGIFGGALGVGLGFLFAQAVSMSVFSRAVAFHPILIPITIGVSVAVTVVACLLPVRSATDIDPALVLKGE